MKQEDINCPACSGTCIGPNICERYTRTSTAPADLRYAEHMKEYRGPKRTYWVGDEVETTLDGTPINIGVSAEEALIIAECEEVKNMLLSKNRKYGNSALQPKRIFSKADTIEQINVRIDDKLSRIANQNGKDDEDAELDLIGYLILKRVKLKEHGNG